MSIMISRLGTQSVRLGLRASGRQQVVRFLCPFQQETNLHRGSTRCVSFKLARRRRSDVTISRKNDLAEEDDIFAKQNVSFGKLTTLEILRALVVLRLCSLPGFAENAEKILRVTQKIVGRSIFDFLMRLTVYNQFVAGDSLNEVRQTTAELKESNLRSIMAVTIEGVECKDEESREMQFDQHLAKAMACIEICKDAIGGGEALMQMRFTALVDSNLLAEISKLNKQSDISTSDLAQWVVDGLSKDTLGLVFPGLSCNQLHLLHRGIRRIYTALEHADQNDVKILIDAEYSWINSALSLLTLAMMKIFNSREPRVWNTYQAYLKETPDRLQQHSKECRDHDVHFAFKLVRGAYLTSETQRAGRHPEHVCDNWEMTNLNYNECVAECLQFDLTRTRVMFATHNEDSIRLAVELLKRKDSESRANVGFAQLYGMGDYMSYALGERGYTVYKSLAYGSVDESLRYLCRRAQENTLFLSGIRKEKEMLNYALRSKMMLNFSK